ncbi:hypothetical protein LCGC14_0450950 [marine sediment metagenome]|uniref:Uncharacterized protein n=1 Tax=marine sediment metagenome TaxID=412755 RepID=A0A0F9SN69_9ZZZZ
MRLAELEMKIQREILLFGTVVVAPTTLTDQDILDAVKLLNAKNFPKEDAWVPVHPSWIKRWEDQRLWWPRFVETVLVLALLVIMLMTGTGRL